jgi:hypothetical protein
MLAHAVLRAWPLVSLRPAVFSLTLTREVVPAFTTKLADPYVTGACAPHPRNANPVLSPRVGAARLA